MKNEDLLGWVAMALFAVSVVLYCVDQVVASALVAIAMGLVGIGSVNCK